MSPTAFLIPKEGLKVADPRGGYLSPDGARVELSSYWRRRLNSGDVVEGKEPKPAAPSTPKTPKPKA